MEGKVNTVRKIVRKILGIYDYDREAEHLIYKSIRLFHQGGKISRWRSIRLYNYIRRNYCCNIYPGITIGNGTYIAHAHDVCIGKTAVIGDNCKIYPHSDITAAVKDDDLRAAMKQQRHATIGNDCILGNGCTIIGPITIGDNVTVGARAIVTKDVPSHMVVKNVNECRAKTWDEIPEKYKNAEDGTHEE